MILRQQAGHDGSGRLLHLFLILAVGILVYSGTFNDPFHFDDFRNIRDNGMIRDIRYFTGGLNPEVEQGYDLFSQRIVGYFTFALNYLISGLDVRGFHAVNIAIHLANAILVYLIFLMTFRTPFFSGSAVRDKAGYAALFAGLLFVSHPVETQAVTYIVQRFTSLSTMFSLLALLSYIACRLTGRTLNRRLFYAGTLVSLALAMKTKEIAFTVPLLIAGYECMFFGWPARKRMLALIPILLTMLIIPFSLFGSFVSPQDAMGEIGDHTRLDSPLSRWSYLMTELRVIVTYMRLLIAPYGQNLDYDYKAHDSLLEPEVFLSGGLILLVLMLAFYLSRTAEKGNRLNRVIAFGVFWFFVTLSVESGLVPILDVIFEHRLYLPSVGAFLAISALAVILHEKMKDPSYKVAFLFFLFTVPIIYGGAAYFRNIVWHSDISLWSDVVQKSPMKIRGHYNLGLAYAGNGNRDKAIAHYLQAIVADPKMTSPYVNLGNEYYKNGSVHRAHKFYVEAVRRNPYSFEAHSNTANVYLEKRQFARAISHYREAVQLRPDFARAHKSLGRAYYEAKDYVNAEASLQEALNLAPTLVDALYYLALVYHDQGLHHLPEDNICKVASR